MHEQRNSVSFVTTGGPVTREAALSCTGRMHLHDLALSRHKGLALPIAVTIIVPNLFHLGQVPARCAAQGIFGVSVSANLPVPPDLQLKGDFDVDSGE